MNTAGFTAIDQEQRIARGQRECYEWQQMPSGAWACTTESGNTYLVTENGCGCPDHIYRCAPSGGDLTCKHVHALRVKLLAEKPKSAAEWLANLDTSAIVAHVEEAQKEDGQDGQEAPAYPMPEDFVGVSHKLSATLGRNVIWGEREEKAFDRIFG